MNDTTHRPSLALARVRSGDDVLWTVRAGDAYAPLGITLSELLALPREEARATVERAGGKAATASIRVDAVLAPVDPAQEVWAAGVTYLRSRDGRIEEATDGSPYDRVYVAERPELFFKATGRRVVAHGEPVGGRADSTWDAPEPELGMVLDARGEIFGFVPGNDASSRSIEGENLLYLPQAKVYTAACALGPEIVPAWLVTPPFDIAMTIVRGGETVFEGTTSTDAMARTLADLADWLFRGLDFPDGTIVLTGTGIVPGADFTLSPGDEVTIDIAGLGTLRNPVVSVGR
ncbi:fumarylacetoacetate hydrolase family protein [Humibacter sp.]|uniref:fumarylacetoacetate hydrolase family protein n=1 Tax=Humibacter sp. TaxID=1940291 RepID=UPI002B7B2D86|nr:fumarylacetoacetate hydrolase family protein [Humibacter sp.]HVX08545.1 fumarylacetoacetate hydrolase family protein [Humibacter sp.]